VKLYLDAPIHLRGFMLNIQVKLVEESSHILNIHTLSSYTQTSRAIINKSNAQLPALASQHSVIYSFYSNIKSKEQISMVFKNVSVIDTKFGMKQFLCGKFVIY